MFVAGICSVWKQLVDAHVHITDEIHLQLLSVRNAVQRYSGFLVNMAHL